MPNFILLLQKMKNLHFIILNPIQNVAVEDISFIASVESWNLPQANVHLKIRLLGQTGIVLVPQRDIILHLLLLTILQRRDIHVSECPDNDQQQQHQGEGGEEGFHFDLKQKM